MKEWRGKGRLRFDLSVKFGVPDFPTDEGTASEEALHSSLGRRTEQSN